LRSDSIPKRSNAEKWQEARNVVRLEHLPEPIQWIAFTGPPPPIPAMFNDRIERTNLLKALRDGIIVGDRTCCSSPRKK